MSASPPGGSRLTFGEFTLDTARATLLRGGQEVKLRPQAYDVLRYMVMNEGRLITKQEFFEQLWPGTSVTDGALVQCVIDVRQALGDHAACVRTVSKRGYVFERPVDQVSHVLSPEPDDVSEREDRPTESAAERPPLRIRRWVIAASLVLVLAIAVATRVIVPRPPVAVAQQPIHSLAVLPLENLSGDPTQDYFADGMTEELITNLAQLGPVRVISRTSIMRFKGTKTPLPEIARDLNVDAVVEGSVTRAGGRVRITAQLIDARTDQHLWARSYERDLGDVLVLQGELSSAIADEVKVQLSPRLREHFTSARRLVPEAEEAYLQGRYHVNKGSEEEIQKGIAFFKQALARNPSDARSYAALAHAFLYLADFYLPSPDMLPQAKEAAVSALALDDTLADSHTALGAVRFLYDWDWPGAEREFQRAIDLNPGSADAHIWYATFLSQAGRARQAIDEVRRAEALDPLSLAIHVEGGWVFYLARQNAEARAEWRRVLDLEPQFAFSHTSIWAAYLDGADFMRARASTKLSPELDTMDLAARIGVSAASGNKDEAGALIARLRQRSAHEYFCPYEMATAEAVLGRTDEAIDWLKKSIAERSACVPSMKEDPRLDSLRSDPRFTALLREANFPP